MRAETAAKGGGGRANYHHGDLRRTLLQAARDEVAASGAAGLSLASLARRAGVAQSAPYRHFAHREALLVALATQGFEELGQALSTAALNHTDPLPCMGLAYARFGEENMELYRLMFASRLVHECGEGSELSEAAHATFAVLLDAVTAQNVEGNPHSIAQAMWAQLHGFIMLKADGLVKEPLEDLVAESHRIPRA